MKTLIRNFGVVALLGATFLYSCKKEEHEQVLEKQSVQGVLDNFAPQMQTFTINPSVDNTITGADGTEIIIPANSLIDQNGNVVSTSVTVNLKEILSLEDQVASGINAVSNGNLLASGGEFFLEVLSGSQKLNVALNKEITVNIPADEVDSTMQVFIGENQKVNYQGDTTKQIVNWLPNDSSFANYDSAYNYVEPDYTLYYTLEGYTMKINDLYNTSYYNIDHFISYNNFILQSPCKIEVEGNLDLEEIVFQTKVVYKQFGSVTYGASDKVVLNSNFTCISSFAIGEKVQYIAVGVGSKTNQIYFAKVSFTVSNAPIPTLVLKPCSLSQLDKELSSL